MIDVLDRVDRRAFIHKKIIGEAVKFGAGFVPGGSTALGLASRISGGGRGGGARPGRLGKAGRQACRASGGTILRRQGQNTVCVPRGGRAPVAVARASSSSPSVPPRNPVREAVLLFKPAPVLKQPAPPRSRIPMVFPSPIQTIARRSTRAECVARGMAFDTGTGQCTPIQRASPMPIHRKARRALEARFAPAALVSGGPCAIPGQRVDQFGNCSFFLGEQLGRDDTPMGQAVMGRYGAAYVPGSMVVDRAVCLAGDVVANDGLCYPKKSITNKQREWPQGRRPLLTGGEMRAISIATRAAGKFSRTQKRLEKLGMIKKPTRARAAAPKHQHLIQGGSLKVLQETN